MLADTVSVSATGSWSNARTTGNRSATCAWYGVPDSSGDDHQVRYGVPLGYSNCPSKDTGHRAQSGFGFQGNDVSAVTPGQPFMLGRFRHYNNPIVEPARPLERVDLRIALTIATAGGSQSPNLDFVLALHETVNDGWCEYDGTTNCPDKSWFVNTMPTDTFTIEGIEYTLEILGFQSSSTYDPSKVKNEFITEENQTNTAYLFGRITARVPAIMVDKSADPTSGMEGDPVQYSYVVSNSGDVALSNVTVSDNKCAPVTPVLSSGFNTGDINKDNKLDTTEQWRYTCSYTVDADDANASDEIVNTVTAQGKYQTTTVIATDTATVTLLTGDDCDDYEIDLTSSRYDAASNTTTFTYTVSVDSDAVHGLSHWVLGLDSCIAKSNIKAASHSYEFGTDPTTGVSGIKFNVAVGKGQSKTFWIRLNGEWPIGLTDTAIKAGQLKCYDKVEGPVCLPSIDVEKSVSVDGGTTWHDADDATGPMTNVGSPVRFKFFVKNSGKYPLSGVSLTDSDLSLSSCSVPTTLAVGASFECTVDATAIAGQHENTATASGQYDGQTVDDSDKAHYFGKSGDLTITKNVVGGTGTFSICITGPSPATTESCKQTSGGPVSWTGLVPGSYAVAEKGVDTDRWNVEIVSSPVQVTNGVTATVAITNTYIPVPGSITIVKKADPESDQSFAFTSDVPDYASFSLVDDGDGAGIGSITMSAAPGTYHIAEDLPDGWALSSLACQLAGDAPGSSYEISGNGVTIALAEGESVTCTFSNRGALSIAGAKFHDLNGDGDQDAGEPGLAGWTIQLEDSKGGVITTTTGANGAYSFDHLVPGSYTVAEVQQTGWRQTAPAAGAHNVTLTDADATGIDFGNQQLGGLTITKTVVGGTGTFNICITGPSPATTESCKSTSGGSVSWPG
ncbi:MAG: hypothetical protein GX616_02740, partial [Planctomycetes bacterium]|nr:hypothetical protein [Planctomycetota bacterium]